MTAVSAYLRVLRDGRNLTQGEAADLAGISSKTIERWEAGKKRPTIATLEPLVLALQGSVSEVLVLLANSNATVEDATRRAREWLKLTPEQRASLEAQRALQVVSDEELAAAMMLYQRLQANPRLLDRWLVYGEGLADADDGDTQ